MLIVRNEASFVKLLGMKGTVKRVESREGRE